MTDGALITVLADLKATDMAQEKRLAALEQTARPQPTRWQRIESSAQPRIVNLLWILPTILASSSATLLVQHLTHH